MTHRTRHSQHKVTLTYVHTVLCTHPLEERQLAQRGRPLLTNIPPSLFPAKAKRANKHAAAATQPHTHAVDQHNLKDKHDAEANKLHEQRDTCNEVKTIKSIQT